MEFISIDADGLTSVIDLRIPQPASKPDATAVRESREARCVRKLARLFDDREDLRGVYAPADQLVETLRWSA